MSKPYTGKRVKVLSLDYSSPNRTMKKAFEQGLILTVIKDYQDGSVICHCDYFDEQAIAYDFPLNEDGKRGWRYDKKDIQIINLTASELKEMRSKKEITDSEYLELLSNVEEVKP